MPQNLTSNYCRRVPRSVNKKHERPELHLPGLTKDEKTCLQQYEDVVQNLCFGTDCVKSTLSNYLKLAVHSKFHNLLRANVFQTIEQDQILHRQFHTLFSEEEGEKVYHKRLENNVKKLMKLPLF